MAEDSHIVYFLTECKINTGSGHLSRCLSLRDAFLERNFQSRFIIDSDESCDFKNAGVDPYILDWKSNFNILKKNVPGESIIIIDSYQATKDQLKKLAEYFSFPVFIADTKMNYYPKGIVLIGNSFASKLKLAGANEAKFLLGSDYILLRKDFWDTKKKLINPIQNSVLITLGEFDKENLIEVVASEVLNQFPDYHLTLISKKNELDFYKNIQYIQKRLNAYEMAELMISHDIVICNGGQTLNECIRTGTPSISIEIADNQHQNIKSWTEKNVSLGITANNDVNSLISQVINNIQHLRKQSIRKKINTLSLKCIDGQGARNACDDIIKYYELKN